jgi:DNA-binding NarL/FixJ family response regulator
VDPGDVVPTRVILADDHKLVRAGFRAMLKTLRDVEVVGETENGREALELIRKHMPDIALLDITMPGLTGLEVAARVSAELPRVRVIILSMHTEDEYIVQAIRAGIAGYLLKNAEPMELELAIRSALGGDIYMSPGISRRVVHEFARKTNFTTTMDLLSPRQREVLQLLAEGNSNKEIATVLKLSIKTVETHRKELMERLGLHDVAGLVRYAIRMGIVQAD